MNGDQQTFEMRRRLARMRSGDARVPRSASALQVWLWLLVFVFQNEFRISMSIQPGYLDFDNLPETNFTCEGKVIGGYYADLETSCQMFHVCTVGQADEPMDIKFLCLNGTVFDQETRVCERVDEVDCTKSEKFYSLNLELYGNTIAPPVKQNVTGEEEADNKREEEKAKEDVSSSQKNKVNSNTNIKVQAETDKVVVQKPHNAYLPTTIASQTESAEHIEPEEENEEEEEIDSELPDYDDDYNPSTTTSTYVTSTRASISTVTSNNKEPIVTTAKPTQSTSDELPSTLDPALLSPQEFIYRHRGQGTEAISFQRQGFRPADGVYITHAPHTNNYEYKYESSRTVARPTNQNAPFVQRPSPAPFRPTNQEPNEQMLRPIAATQATNPTNQRAAPYPPASLPPQRALPYEPYYYERKRSEVTSEGDESSLSARSISLPPIEKNSKMKSPPRVIVTASASVSDSNGKRLNYTVGNVVSAVKPIVPINYDDYKETDLIFDPFFLDVPKLSKRRKSRHDKDDTTTTKHNPRAIHSRFIAEKKYAGLRKSFTATPTSIVKSTTPHSVNVNDYVDDNYEPHVYKPPHADINKPEENKVASLEDDKKYVNYDNQRLSIRTKDKTIETTKLTTSSQSPLLETPIINPPRIVAHNNHPKTVCRTCV